MRQYETFELVLRGSEQNNAWAQVDVMAEFIHGDEHIKVPGFYAGDGIYKVRFLPLNSGTYTWRVRGSVNADGQAVCEPAVTHGPVRARGRGFVYADGTAYHSFGTTVYALAHQPHTLIEQTMATLAEAPFNKLRLCVFPKDYDFNKNEPDFYPFQKNPDGSWDVARPCFAFWDALEEIIIQLGDMGIQADLILFHPYDRWGFDGMGLGNDLVYLDYLLRRLSAFPNVWWSMANEYELTSRGMAEWDVIEKFIAEHDPYDHPLSCHNIFQVWDANHPHITHASIQSKDLVRIHAWQQRFPGKPVIIDECAYEGDIEPFWGSITGKEMSRRFWRCVSQGAYCTHGETFYDENDVLWWAKGGVLHGESPARIAFCRKITESLPGQLEGEVSSPQRMLGLFELDDAEREDVLRGLPDKQARMVRAFLMSGSDALSFANSEFCWYGHIGTEVYLRFHDARPISRDTVELPSDRTYTIRLLDTWNMTDEVVATGLSGRYTVRLPGREDMAVLIEAE